MWWQYWNLRHDPFLDPTRPWVPLDSHREVLHRLLHLVESGYRLIPLRAEGGLGKTALIGEALRRLASPRRRVAHVIRPIDAETMAVSLALALGAPTSPLPYSFRPWDVLRLAAARSRLEGLSLIFAVDGDDLLDDPLALERLTRVDPDPTSRLCVLAAGPPNPDVLLNAPWSLSLDLPPLTLEESRQLLRTRLAHAGRTDRLLTPAAEASIHHLASGSPAGLCSLARLALRIGAEQRTRFVGPDQVDLAASECPSPDRLLLPPR